MGLSALAPPHRFSRLFRSGSHLSAAANEYTVRSRLYKTLTRPYRKQTSEERSDSSRFPNGQRAVIDVAGCLGEQSRRLFSCMFVTLTRKPPALANLIALRFHPDVGATRRKVPTQEEYTC
ncbi:protein of unknown function (plasmid) [Caballeronia sp. S22]